VALHQGLAESRSGKNNARSWISGPRLPRWRGVINADAILVEAAANGLR
jgi:hypothetical protein